jgi:Rps23 Pro-64 3,4-dihydroxylase Tpa1-like proline 4-hydroxylase
MIKPGVHHGMNGLTTSQAVLLEKFYADKELSVILKIFKKTLNSDLIRDIVQRIQTFIKLQYINSVFTKVRYYHDGEGYGPHTDVELDFLTFSYFHTHPRKFTGGDLYCPDYNYTIDCSDNTFVLFPFYIKHEVLPVTIPNDEYWNGNGRYCVSQFLNLIPSNYDGKK